MKPDITKHNYHFPYIRRLVEKIGITQSEAARRIGISERSIRSYLANPETAGTAVKCPYPVQFALEVLAGVKECPSCKNRWLPNEDNDPCPKCVSENRTRELRAIKAMSNNA